ncbi:MAG TPA: Rieske 2Fe-2S domain-containing protein [Chthonomonadaceae bacterium]|nr:Rieske 2Fe-2S domain-containing protein [Chthonomonadaceae bacterium]
MAWTRVAAAADLKPGLGTAVIAGGHELALFLVEGRLYCIENRCPHMDGPLSEGDVEGDIVYCPWHYWPINIRTGALTFDDSACAPTYPCKVEDGGVLVDI